MLPRSPTFKAVFTRKVCVCVKHHELGLWDFTFAFLGQQRSKKNASAHVMCKCTLTCLDGTSEQTSLGQIIDSNAIMVG